MENNLFTKFEYFGKIGSQKLRKQLAESIYYALQDPSGKNVSLTDTGIQNYLPAINQILSNNTLRQLCQKDSQLAEVITQEILDFINGSKREINITDSPFSKELSLLEQFVALPKHKFKENWESYVEYFNKNYRSGEINTEFYSQEFSKSLKLPKPQTDTQSFESIKEHLTDRWLSLLFIKQTDFELSIIDQWRKKITEDLYKRIEELKKLQDALEPITGELGRLWDMSKGNWQKVNFDVLTRYADLLKKDKAIAELAEMLGRMRQAEQEYEEETFLNIIPQPKLVIEPAHKSDLIGVHESDDISSMLPSEAAFLSDPVLQTIFVKKFAEKKLQTFEFQSRSLQYQNEEVEEKRQKTKEEKGPFIICVDTSGSMHGTPETVAKTLCFAILKIALQEKRKCYLISFSTGISTLNLTDIKNSLDRLIDFLQMSFHGGTDATPAVKEALRMLETQDYKQADVLMISDFIMSGFDKQTELQITQAKENKTKFHSLVIGSSHNQAVINSFDSNWHYNSSNPQSIITLVSNLKNMSK